MRINLCVRPGACDSLRAPVPLFAVVCELPSCKLVGAQTRVCERVILPRRGSVAAQGGTSLRHPCEHVPPHNTTANAPAHKALAAKRPAHSQQFAKVHKVTGLKALRPGFQPPRARGSAWSRSRACWQSCRSCLTCSVPGCCSSFAPRLGRNTCSAPCRLPNRRRTRKHMTMPSGAHCKRSSASAAPLGRRPAALPFFQRARAVLVSCVPHALRLPPTGRPAPASP